MQSETRSLFRLTTMLVRVLHAYSATAETELSVQPDERLTLIEGDSEGWVQVATLDGQREGFVPTSYVTLDEAVDDDDGGSSVSSHGSFTTVAPSRAAQPNIIAAKALGAQLAGRLAAATSRDAQGVGASACASDLYEPFGDLKIDETQPSSAEEELVAPWDSVSCLGEEPLSTPPARGLRLLPHEDGRPSPTKGGVRVVRPPTLQALLVAAHAKQAVLWPGAPLCVGLALYDEDGCEVSAWVANVATALRAWPSCVQPLRARHTCAGGCLQPRRAGGRGMLVARGGRHVAPLWRGPCGDSCHPPLATQLLPPTDRRGQLQPRGGRGDAHREAWRRRARHQPMRRWP